MRLIAMLGLSAVLLSGCGESAPPAASAPPARLGEAVVADGLEYIITGIEERQVVGDNPYMQARASEGATLVVVSWSMKNISDRPVEFYERGVMHLVNPSGVQLSSDDEATIAFQTDADLSEKMLSDLNPGITTRGADVYEVAGFDRTTWRLNIANADRQVSLAAP